MSIKKLIPIPPLNPKLNPPHHEIVFVDPDDPTVTFWWPGIIVPRSEFAKFRESMRTELVEPTAGEVLVCYFEDGSFSIVTESGSQ